MENDPENGSALSRWPDIAFPLGKMMRSYFLWGFAVLGIGLVIELTVFREKFLFSLGISWTILFLSGFISLIITHWIQKRYKIGVLSLAVGTLFRGGFPLMAVLALIFILDNNILIEVMILLLIYYGVFLAFETGIVLKAVNNRYK